MDACLRVGLALGEAAQVDAEGVEELERAT